MVRYLHILLIRATISVVVNPSGNAQKAYYFKFLQLVATLAERGFLTLFQDKLSGWYVLAYV